MASKLSQVLILLTAVSATFQRNLVSDNDANSFNTDGVENFMDHLKTHVKQDAKPYLDKQQSDLSSLLNIQTLNMYIKGDKAKQDQRSGVEQDRICKKTGRCGCRGDRCDDREDREESKEVQQILDELEREMDKDSLRCAERCGDGERCGCRGRSEDRDEEDQLRCGNGRCGRERNENSLMSKLERLGRKYKINDNLDAIVVDISNAKGLLGRLNGNLKQGHQNQDREIDLDYLYGDTRNSDDKEDTVDLDAVVLNLGQKKNDDDLVSKVVKDILYKTKQRPERNNDPIRPNELADFFEARKQKVIGNALNFVRNSRGDKDLSVLSDEQKYKLQKIRSEVQRLGAKTNLQQIERKVVDIILGDGLKSEVLPHLHRNNNVYIPKWVYNAVVSSRDDLRSKRLFPLTNKQKLKMYKFSGNKPSFWRRNIQNSVNEYGVPFQLHVEGLGQINP